jgi:hypothetical protein
MTVEFLMINDKIKNKQQELEKKRKKEEIRGSGFRRSR